MTIAQILRQKAEGLQKKIDHCFRERLTNTRKRAEEDAAQRREGYTLKATQDIMRKLADMHEAGTCPEPVRAWRHVTEVETAVRVVRSAERQKEEYGDRNGECLKRLSEEQKIVRRLMQPPDPKAERLHTLMRDSVRRNIPGYHPTGRAAVEQMVELADFNKPGMTVLEPSAGRGDILDVVREKFGDNVSLTVIEYNHSLKEILCLKGYEVQTENDFLEWSPVDGVLFDRILMNPPFEKFQDIDHVRHAYTFLKPGGRLVAIMSPGTFFRKDKKPQAFQDDYGDCKIVTLESGSFESTGITAKMIVIDKPAAFERYPVPEPVHFAIDEGLAAQNEVCVDLGLPPIAGTADPEYETRLDAERVTAEFGTKSQRRFDSGRKPITESPLFGGEAQMSLF